MTRLEPLLPLVLSSCGKLYSLRSAECRARWAGPGDTIWTHRKRGALLLVLVSLLWPVAAPAEQPLWNSNQGEMANGALTPASVPGTLRMRG